MNLETLKSRAKTNGKTLTQPRADVFAVLKGAEVPHTAYDIVEAMPDGTKPMTVYRALEFLTELGAAHRIESLNAYIACGENHCAHVDSQYLICTTCGRVNELHNHKIDHFIKDALAADGFSVTKKSIEILGVCQACG